MDKNKKFSLSVNDKCDECGRCEVALPGLVERAQEGTILINGNNRAVNWGGIKEAISRCHLGAIELQEVTA